METFKIKFELEEQKLRGPYIDKRIKQIVSVDFDKPVFHHKINDDTELNILKAINCLYLEVYTDKKVDVEIVSNYASNKDKQYAKIPIWTIGSSSQIHVAINIGGSKKDSHFYGFIFERKENE
jgi:hypothetical protein